VASWISACARVASSTAAGRLVTKSRIRVTCSHRETDAEVVGLADAPGGGVLADAQAPRQHVGQRRAAQRLGRAFGGQLVDQRVLGRRQPAPVGLQADQQVLLLGHRQRVIGQRGDRGERGVQSGVRRFDVRTTRTHTSNTSSNHRQTDARESLVLE
jgi:hypothetical protein